MKTVFFAFFWADEFIFQKTACAGWAIGMCLNISYK